MFDKKFDVESLPERVYELCKVIAAGSNSIDDIKWKIQPIECETQYFNNLRDTAINLNLVERNDSKGTLSFVQSKEVLKDIESFRLYCNSIVWKIDCAFCEIAKVFLNSNERWLAYPNITSNQIINEVGQATGYTDNRYMLGERFWLSFLGFGYVFEVPGNIQVLPNMSIALRDFIELSGVQKGEKYELGEFFKKIRLLCPVAIPETNNQTLSLALSCALRQLHDGREIRLTRESDAKAIWRLVPFATHEIEKEVSHIEIRRGK